MIAALGSPRPAGTPTTGTPSARAREASSPAVRTATRRPPFAKQSSVSSSSPLYEAHRATRAPALTPRPATICAASSPAPYATPHTSAGPFGTPAAPARAPPHAAGPLGGPGRLPPPQRIADLVGVGEDVVASHRTSSSGAI